MNNIEQLFFFRMLMDAGASASDENKVSRIFSCIWKSLLLNEATSVRDCEIGHNSI